jgi:hypothetical protein
MPEAGTLARGGLGAALVLALLATGGSGYMVTSYDQVREVTEHPELYSRAKAVAPGLHPRSGLRAPEDSERPGRLDGRAAGVS